MSVTTRVQKSAIGLSAESRLKAGLTAANSGFAELEALQRYAEDRCIELNAKGVKNDCPNHCDVVLTDDELSAGRAALARAKQRRSVR